MRQKIVSFHDSRVFVEQLAFAAASRQELKWREERHRRFQGHEKPAEMNGKRSACACCSLTAGQTSQYIAARSFSLPLR